MVYSNRPSGKMVISISSLCMQYSLPGKTPRYKMRVVSERDELHM
jgi:hypothetical protein